ncbi:hypothetical protein LguiA_019472 [Lonicera macranthoides]
MRFVAMKLLSTKAKINSKKSGRENDSVDDSDRHNDDDSDKSVSSSLAGQDAVNNAETDRVGEDWIRPDPIDCEAKINSKKNGRENNGVDDSDRQSDDDSD